MCASGAVHQPSGVDSLDIFRTGAAFATIGNMSLYQIQAAHRKNEASKNWDDLMPLLSEAPPTRASRCLVMRYEPLAGQPAVDHAVVFKVLSDAFVGFKSIMAVGRSTDSSVLVLMRKEDNKYLPSFDVPNTSRTLWTFPRGQPKNHHNIISVFAQSLCLTITTMDATTSDTEFSVEQIISGTAHMSEADLRMLKASIVVKPVSERSIGDSAVLRVMPHLIQIRADRDPFGESTLFWSAARPPIPVVGRRHLRNLDQTGRRLVEQSDGLEFEECSLQDLLDNLDLLRRFAIVLMGPDGSTGFGKSAFAKHLAVVFARHMCATLGLPPTDATVCWTSTIDDLSSINIKRGWAVAFDEFSVGCKDTVQYMSEGMFKILADPQSSGNLRARAKNARLATDTARIMTCNARTPTEWANGRFVWSAPIQRKCIVFRIDRAIVVPAWSSLPDYVDGDF